MRTTRNRIGLLLTMLALAFLALDGTAFAAAAKEKKPMVDLNTATQKELEELPGVGEATAKKIIAGRPYKSVADLAKAGVPEKTISKIEKQVTVSGGGAAAAPMAAAPAAASSASSTAATSKSAAASTKGEASKMEKSAPAATAGAMRGAKVDLNTASEKELEDLPGVGPATAKKIIAGRPYSSVADLSKAGVNKSTMDKIGGMVTVSGKAASTEAAPPAKPAAAAAPAADTSRSASSSASSSSKMTSQAASGKAAEAASGTPQQPPVKGMVWVNTETKVFHREGDHWYGNTKQGKFMTEADAIKAGYRESKQKMSSK